jgi:hypothetical protein
VSRFVEAQIVRRTLPAGAVALAGCLSVVLGLLIARGDLRIVALLAAGSLLTWLALARPGIAVGGLWLVALNGIPLINLETGEGQLRSPDIAVIAIVGVAVVRWLFVRERRPPFPAKLAIASVAFSLWWFVVLVRSLNAGIPVADASLYGRDFLSFTILMPAAWVVLRTPKAWRECLVVVLAGAGLYSLAYVGGALGLIDATSFAHPHLTSAVGSFQRLYTPMNDLVITVAVFGVAVLATTRNPRAVFPIAALTAITLLAFLFQLTRAAYLGMAIGGIVAICVAIAHGGAVRRVVARRTSALALVACICLFAVLSLGGGGGPTGIIGERITSGISQVDSNSGTVGYRVKLYHSMLGVLSSDWPVGLGFLHPRDRYFGDLPAGSIRNPDVGLMNAVMTMGLLGLGLLFGVLVAFARYVIDTRDGRPAWLVVGMFGWLAVLVSGSLTLVTLFSPTGLVSTALTLVMCGAYVSNGAKAGGLGERSLLARASPD